MLTNDAERKLISKYFTNRKVVLHHLSTFLSLKAIFSEFITKRKVNLINKN